MELEELEVERQEVETELTNIKTAIKEGYITRRTALARDLLAVYGHLKHGGKIVDIYKAFSKAGLDEDGHPKISIAPFNAKWCYLYKKRNGGAIFSSTNKDTWQIYAVKANGDIALPADTYDWDSETQKKGTRWKCVSPIVPPRVLTIASAKLTPQHYHIIFEPEIWSKAKVPTPPRDPILGKMLTPNIFGVVATWDLTELERSIIRGRL